MNESGVIVGIALIAVGIGYGIVAGIAWLIMRHRSRGNR